MKSFIILAVVAVSFNAFSVASKPVLKDVALTWKPTSDLSDITKLDLSKMIQAKFKMAKLSDERTVKPMTKVGENVENDKEFLPVETTSDVAEFVTNNMKDTLSKAGFDFVENGETYLLSGQLKDFFTTEKNTYQTRLLVKFTLTKGGKVLWTGVVAGGNKRFGKSYKLENYMESLSDSVLDATHNLLSNDGFRKQFN